MLVAEGTLRGAIGELGLAGHVICLHSSLRSFGEVEGGPDTVIDAFLAEGCTLVVPAYSWDAYSVRPPTDDRPERNGTDYPRPFGKQTAPAFDSSSREIDRDEMGAIPAAVVARRGRSRGGNPLCSFAALGPEADAVVGEQSADDMYTPLREVVSRKGAVVLAGVTLTSMTLLHLAEQDAGREPFVRWATRDGRTARVRVGGCSSGFDGLRDALRPAERIGHVGNSTWIAYDAAHALELATRTIEEHPEITVCPDRCVRCIDAVAGGPLA